MMPAFVPVVNLALVHDSLLHLVRCNGPLHQCSIVFGVFFALDHQWPMVCGGVDAHAIPKGRLVLTFQMAFTDVMA